MSQPDTGAALEAVTGRIDSWRGLPGTAGLEPALEYLAGLDAARVVPGRTPIVGDSVYALASSYDTRAGEALRFEAHRLFIDVQYVVAGQETIGFLPSTEGLRVVEPFNAEKDIELFEVPPRYSSLPIKAGRFAVFRTGQAHLPGCHLEGIHRVVKVVVKVSAGWYAGRHA
jgi:YhcH/YjgK/YiaL family protein